MAKEKFEPYVIKRWRMCKRGYGSMTAALFRDEKGDWDYVEVIYGISGEYQSSAHGLSRKDADKMLGKNINEVASLKSENGMPFHILEGKWHRTEISDSGEILSMRC